MTTEKTVPATVRLPASTWALLRKMAEHDMRELSKEIDYIIRMYSNDHPISRIKGPIPPEWTK